MKIKRVPDVRACRASSGRLWRDRSKASAAAGIDLALFKPVQDFVEDTRVPERLLVLAMPRDVVRPGEIVTEDASSGHFLG
ncbi:hypothetical protein [Cupriavidus sp. L7L]|uniref:hypothetical protein n=1 Tax=Cupriavidus sp. L7L TaxID=2546443 RepID=UPI001055678E|nr:hypothetical protein [Cupriavidus sp. L7L]TDF67228.1 hypothetical protein E1J61_02705 [Cupriavidus sp. L7L]